VDRLPGMPRLLTGTIALPRLPGLAGPRGSAGRPQQQSDVPRLEDEKKPWLKPPSTWLGSIPQWAIYWAHGRATPARGEEGIFWAFQGSPRGGFFPLDFIEFDLQVTIDVNEEGISKSSALATALALAGLVPPYQHVIVDEEDALTNPIFYLNEAFQGRTYSSLGSLLV